VEVANRVMVEAWNTVLYEKFCRFRHLIVDGVSQHSDAAFDRCRFPVGSRVLDVGCGFGNGTLSIAKRVGPAGEAVGLDCAEKFVRAAEMAAREERVENARFIVSDAQTGDLLGPYDHAFASFGTMFFLTPEDAMANVRMALKPGGTFMQIVWRRREDNPWLFDAEQRSVSSLMCRAGFERISFERHDCDICIGRDLDDAVDFAMSLGPAGEIIRLAGEEGTKRRPHVVAALRDVLAPYVQQDGVWAPSSTWFIAASNPS
jgi:SAM-dependent methyltransferase